MIHTLSHTSNNIKLFFCLENLNTQLKYAPPETKKHAATRRELRVRTSIVQKKVWGPHIYMRAVPFFQRTQKKKTHTHTHNKNT
jgi:hypothetical protein